MTIAQIACLVCSMFFAFASGVNFGGNHGENTWFRVLILFIASIALQVVAHI